MSQLLCYQYLLIGAILLWGFSVSKNNTLCNIGCEAQGDICLNSLTKLQGLDGIMKCIKKKFKCMENCNKASRTVVFTSFSRTKTINSYITKRLCPKYCKAVYDRIDAACTKKCSEKLLGGK